MGDTRTTQVGDTRTTQVGDTRTTQVGDTETTQVGDTETTQVGDKVVFLDKKIERKLDSLRKRETVENAIQDILRYKESNQKLPSKRDVMSMGDYTDHIARKALSIVREVEEEERTG